MVGVLIVLVVLAFGFAGWMIYAAYTGALATWGGLGSLTGGSVTGLLVDGYAGLSDWTMRGLTLTSWGGLLLAVGLAAFIIVMIVNLAASRGRTLVR